MNLLFSFENLARKSLILYSISRFIFIKIFKGILYEKEANGFKNLNKKNKLNIVDVGINDGLSTSFLNIFKNSNIYAFEPLKIKNNKFHKINNNKIKLYNIGLGKKIKVLI